MVADPHPRGWFESSPPERQAIVRAHRELWAECVRECEEAPDGEAEWGACRKRFLRSSLIAAELEEGSSWETEKGCVWAAGKVSVDLEIVDGGEGKLTVLDRTHKL